ncbi:unnamed protein product [Strongylus vulgaris]|uniref:Uncharacterized protein n=1 Tax=Strongylus vulgaris TaxID=40348 RepID=A0A3P7IPV9_STRVU|nr:unnamed protein product [Strongylus vulgaris]
MAEKKAFDLGEIYATDELATLSLAMYCECKRTPRTNNGFTGFETPPVEGPRLPPAESDEPAQYLVAMSEKKRGALRTHIFKIKPVQWPTRHRASSGGREEAEKAVDRRGDDEKKKTTARHRPHPSVPAQDTHIHSKISLFRLALADGEKTPPNETGLFC